ncbi:dimethyl sulfoxide reductase anchor subunit [Desulfosarcina widdelii]|uniref:dimethyl sulfoxide reductase anchor subunit n=1 Tax=Desulfosarcina widdelii TaxID=947919 RepID=UPI0012D34CC5|nr:dimethyl sulfoxide reductase anchor subunit [Desulfosarcina widdelii]
MDVELSFLKILQSSRQRTWKWPAVVNLTLGGAGAGVYLFGALFPVFGGKWPVEVQIIPFQLLAAIIVCSGFFFLSMEAGRPARAYRLFSNMGSSWMSIESFAGVNFIIFALISYFYPLKWITAAGGTAALILLLSQGFMVFGAVAVSAWNERLIPILFVTSGMIAANGLVLINTHADSATAKIPTLFFIVFSFCNLLLWGFYLFGQCREEFRKSVDFLRRPFALLLIGGLGHIVPLCFMLLLFLSIGSDRFALLSQGLYLISGGLLFFGSVCQKIGIILAAGYYRPIVFQADTD